MSKEQAEILTTNSKGVYSLNEFLEYLGSHPEDRGGYNLGISNVQNMYEAVGKGLGLMSWWDACDKKHIYPRDPFPTDKFLQEITKENKPIVFFVPSHVLTFSLDEERNITRDEMRWFLDKIEKGEKVARNTFFVFGLYDAFSKSDIINLLTKYADETDFIYIVGNIF